ISLARDAEPGPWAAESARAVSRGPFGLQPLDHVQGVVDVVTDAGHRVEDVAHRAFAVDDIGDPAGQQSEDRGEPVALAYLSALVADQRERQLVPTGECGVAVD